MKLYKLHNNEIRHDTITGMEGYTFYKLLNKHNLNRVLILRESYEDIVAKLGNDKDLWESFSRAYVKSMRYKEYRLTSYDELILGNENFHIKYPVTPRGLAHNLIDILLRGRISTKAAYVLIFNERGNIVPKYLELFLYKQFKSISVNLLKNVNFFDVAYTLYRKPNRGKYQSLLEYLDNNKIYTYREIKFSDYREETEHYKVTGNTLTFNIYTPDTKEINIKFAKDITHFVDTKNTLRRVLINLDGYTESRAYLECLKNNKIEPLIRYLAFREDRWKLLGEILLTYEPENYSDGLLYLLYNDMLTIDKST